MTECSTCGYAVEWLRSCKASRWRLFANAPEIVTDGEYYFLPEEAEFYPDWHCLWSREWVTEEATADTQLGELPGFSRW